VRLVFAAQPSAHRTDGGRYRAGTLDVNAPAHAADAVFAAVSVAIGLKRLGCIVALYCRSSTSFQIR
jgi:hypothetical protein